MNNLVKIKLSAALLLQNTWPENYQLDYLRMNLHGTIIRTYYTFAL